MVSAHALLLHCLGHLQGLVKRLALVAGAAQAVASAKECRSGVFALSAGAACDVKDSEHSHEREPSLNHPRSSAQPVVPSMIWLEHQT